MASIGTTHLLGLGFRIKIGGPVLCGAVAASRCTDNSLLLWSGKPPSTEQKMFRGYAAQSVPASIVTRFYVKCSRFSFSMHVNNCM